MLNSSSMVEQSTARNDSSGVITPSATMSMAPRRAPAGRPMGMKLSSLAAIRTYVRANTAIAAAVRQYLRFGPHRCR